MSEYKADVIWEIAEGDNFLSNQYSRGHVWRFDGGLEVPASSAPSVVPLPFSVAENVDPEEAFVASLSSCHMLWFLALAAKYKFSVACYQDSATGVMEKNPEGKVAITRVTLRPNVEFAGENIPSAERVAKLHHDAHERCFIANSVKTRIDIEPC